jgi:predicted RNase H-like nuclease (RuvC/YqgF family)
MPTQAERVARLEAKAEDHEGRHERFEKRIEEHMTAVGERLLGMSRHLQGIETEFKSHLETLRATNGTNGGRSAAVRKHGPSALGGAGLGAVVVEVARFAMGG